MDFTQNASSFTCSQSALYACTMVPNHVCSIYIGSHIMTEFISASPMLSGSFTGVVHIFIRNIYTLYFQLRCTLFIYRLFVLVSKFHLFIPLWNLFFNLYIPMFVFSVIHFKYLANISLEFNTFMSTFFFNIGWQV